MVRVELDDIEVSVGHMIGTMRQAAVRLSHFATSTTGRDKYADHIDGALGEMAVAKGLDLYWDASVNSFKSRPDVSALEVRTTTYRPPRCSIYVSDRDDGAAKYILVSKISKTEYDLLGWASGDEIRQRGEYKSMAAGRSPQYWLQAGKLNSMSTLQNI